MRQSDFIRGQDRARIDSLFNGRPPYSEQEVTENAININVNDLSATRLGHDARAQFYSAFLKPGQYFSCKTDSGAQHKRREYGTIVTNEINKRMKRSLDYFECFRSKFALNILHGIGPAIWDNEDNWCPEPMAISDLLIPANTLLTFKNLPFFAVQRSYTAPQLIKMARGKNTDPGWNTELVEECIRWIDRESMALLGQNYPDIWSPEKVEERIKGSGSFYCGDAVPTLNVFDFFYWSDEGKSRGWRRRMVIDDWVYSGAIATGSKNEKLGFIKNQFLYDSKERVFAEKRSEIFSCQFADLSAVSPFHYHTVRSLGFLLYAVCHMQNRLRCKFNESVFEALTMYFRVKNEDDVQRALKVNLVNKGFIDESLSFVPAQDRFQVRADLVSLGLQSNQQLMEQNVASYRQNPNFAADNIEKTKFQVMAEMNATTQLVSAGLTQAYRYQDFEYEEVFRRFTRKNSQDPDVISFQSKCLAQKVPEKILYNPAAWEIESERVMGGGNKTMEMAIAQQLMQYRQLYDPEAQRTILRDVTLALTDDPARANDLVPQEPTISNSVHDAQLSIGTLMTGAPLAIKGGINRQEYIAALLISMQAIVQQIEQTGGMATKEQLIGLQNVSSYIAQNIEVLAQDESSKQLVKQFGDQLGQLNNVVKGYAQRYAEQAQAEQGGNGDISAETMAKIQSEQIKAQAKAANTRESHAARTAQKQISFEMDEQRKQQQFETDLQHQQMESAMDLRFKAMEAQLAALTKQLSVQQKPETTKTE